MLKALVFDVDGTLADTESAHRAAFNHAFAEQGMDWHWDEALYTELLHISGGKERIAHYWQRKHPDLRDIAGMAMQDAVNRLHAIKTAAYSSAVNDGAVPLRPGVLSLMAEAQAQGLQLAIATTTTPVNIDALLRRAMGADWRMNFSAVGDASTAPLKKPHPQVYVQVLDALHLPAEACVALEDSSNGLQAARAAGLATVITPTRYTDDHDFRAAMRVLPDLTHISLPRLRAWHREALYNTASL